ncbi:MAG TPA: UDP-N-acetylmuramoyl-tripeptide--D-alanyl-D-alanine ligase [Cellvibrionaceae bacterium]
MIGSLSLAELQAAWKTSLNAKLLGESIDFSRVSTDSREIQPGDLFVALRGAKFNGHTFLESVQAQGAAAALVDRIDPTCTLPQLQVDDTTLGLGQLALLNRKKFKKPLIAITGSSGKTTVRSMVEGILREKGAVLCTTGNFNNHIGVPLTLLRLDGSEICAVIEMGASAIGEIAYLCELAEPDVVMVNNVMPAHLSGFGSLEGVADAKGEIYQGVSEGGYCVVNKDEHFASQWLGQIHDRRVITFSLSDSSADCWAENIQSLSGVMTFTLHLPDGAIPVSLPVAGLHMLANALAAAACARAVGATHQNIINGLESFAPVAGRMNHCLGPCGSLVIDDAYNANPGSVKAAIDVLADCQGARILLMGDMGELGDEAWFMHAQIGLYASAKALDAVFTVGDMSRAVSESFTGPTRHFENQQQLIQHVKHIITDSDYTLLVKGSRSARMDRVVSALTQVEAR